ncbi:phage holin family protein [Ruminiclostridium cellobioparum]|jgi:toxin secretion/phage lysis holin|uniref:phage holin family protein n=1 Tax=Ruminiclostridium cellobioparum TaxID=29355 RepID=UPI0004873749|nr:phage holin family protein [Ruminiclostridium cellobioparum]
MEKINSYKASIIALLTSVSALLGWFGWLVITFVVCMSVDWITGSMAAWKRGEWESKIAREGIWHKTGSIIAVLVTLILDAVIGNMINNIPSVSLPFTYTVLLSPIVIVWYILTELGSIIENAGRMGAPVPVFLQRAIALLKESVDAAGEKTTENK